MEYDWAGERGEKWKAVIPELHIMLDPIDPPLIDSLNLDQPYKIADIACGGGGTSKKVLEQAPAGSSVHGFDISPALIEACKDQYEGVENLRFTLLDVSKNPSPEGKFDRLVSRFGVMFFEDHAAAFKNLAGWLKPGGRFSFAVWGLPKKNPWMMVVKNAIEKVIEVPSPDPEAPGPFRYADGREFSTLLERSGFKNMELAEWEGDLLVGGGLDAGSAANFAISNMGIGELLQEEGEDAVQKGLKFLTEGFKPFERDGKVSLGSHVLVVSGTI